MRPNTSISKISVWPIYLLAAAALLPVSLLWKPVLVLPLAFILPAVLFLKHPDWIIYIVITIAFTRADAWLSAATGLPFGLAASGLILLSYLLLLTFTAIPLQAPNRSAYVLIMFYLGAFLAGSLAGNNEQAFEWSRDAMYAFLIFSVVYSLSFNKHKFETALMTVAACGLLLSLINLLEILYPSLIQLSHSEGRAAGLLKNANSSAFAISCSYVIFMFLYRRHKFIPRYLNLLAQIVFILGVLATFSRQGLIIIIICFLTANFIMAKDRKSLVGILLILALTAGTVFLIVQNLLGSDNVPFLYSLDRITSFVQGNLADNDRWYLAKYYLGKALEQPLLGYGFNATTVASTANTDLQSLFGVKGPHNTPITLLVEFGIIPLLLFGYFFYLLYNNLKSIPDRIERRLLLLLLFSLFLHNCFAHDLHISRYTLTLFALLAVPVSVYSGSPQTDCPKLQPRSSDR